MAVRSLILVASLLLTGCAITPHRPAYDRDIGGYPEEAEPPGSGFQQTGIISYYSDKFHGRKTASGERFDKDVFTAAHRTLPFGTRIKVTNLANGKSVVVTVNDRGPFARNRILDLSQAAARELGMIGAGTVTAKIEVL